MKERPILFSAPMVRAILAGRKPQPSRMTERESALLGWAGGWKWKHEMWTDDARRRCVAQNCPHGMRGDRLWVRESWQVIDDCPKGCGSDDGSCKEHRRVVYRADGEDQIAGYVESWSDKPCRWLTPLHLRRRDARLTLEVTSVRVERLHDIADDDAKAEGVEFFEEAAALLVTGWNLDAFAELWDSINGKRAPWASNPWVWVVEFARVP